MKLTDDSADTLLSYQVNAQVGGKLAQLGVDISALNLPEPTPAELRRPDRLRPPCIGALGIHAR